MSVNARTTKLRKSAQALVDLWRQTGMSPGGWTAKLEELEAALKP